LAQGSRETLAGEVAAAAAPERRASVTEGAFSPLAPVTADSLRSLLGRIERCSSSGAMSAFCGLFSTVSAPARS
jgi:hypothetical protein